MAFIFDTGYNELIRAVFWALPADGGDPYGPDVLDTAIDNNPHQLSFTLNKALDLT